MLKHILSIDLILFYSQTLGVIATGAEHKNRRCQNLALRKALTEKP